MGLSQLPPDPNDLNPWFRQFVDHVQYIMVSWRVFPIMLLFFWMKISFDVIAGMKDAAMDGVGAAAILAATVGSAAAYFKFYVETGPNGKFDQGQRYYTNRDPNNVQYDGRRGERGSERNPGVDRDSDRESNDRGSPDSDNPPRS